MPPRKLSSHSGVHKSRYQLRPRCVQRNVVSEEQLDIYEPLPEDLHQIRVLLLAPGQRTDVLRGTFELVSIKDDQPAPYETISYVWGDASKNNSIILSGRTLMVPAKTAAALRRMRYPTTTRRLWIDAVCINQGNVDERGQQVSLMGSIYRRSRGNLVHLTDDEEAGRRIVQVIMSIDQEIRNETDEYRKFRATVFHESGKLRIRQSQTRSRSEWAIIGDLVRLPWFR